MSDYLKKTLYAGITIATGVAGFFLGKYKHSRRIFPTTALGLILIMCAPRGFDLVEKYMTFDHDMKKQELRREIKKDSIDSMLELQHPEIKLTSYMDKKVNEISDINKNLATKYNTVLAETERSYKKSLDSVRNQNKKILVNLDNKFSEQNYILENKLSDLQKGITNVKTLVTTPKDYSSNSLDNAPKASKISNVTKSIDHYLIDLDKSDRWLSVYAVYDNGSMNSLALSSRASFPVNGGPDEGEYYVENKGSRDGELYPGFLSINDPVGISGAGDYNQYLDAILDGALINKTGIRIPNEIYARLAQAVDTKPTIISIHE
jgi:hypothetical protein